MPGQFIYPVDDRGNANDDDAEGDSKPKKSSRSGDNVKGNS